MMTPLAATLPATVRFVEPWSDEDRAQVIAALTPLIPALTVPWTLTYEHDPTATTRTLAVIPHAYSAAVERDGLAHTVISRSWDLPMFLRQLAATSGRRVPVFPFLFPARISLQSARMCMVKPVPTSEQSARATHAHGSQSIAFPFA